MRSSWFRAVAGSGLGVGMALDVGFWSARSRRTIPPARHPTTIRGSPSSFASPLADVASRLDLRHVFAALQVEHGPVDPRPDVLTFIRTGDVADHQRCS